MRGNFYIPCLILIFKLYVTCGGTKISSTIKMSHNIMNMISHLDLYPYFALMTIKISLIRTYERCFDEPEPFIWMNENLGNTLRNSSNGCDVSGILVVSCRRIFVEHLILDPNLWGDFLTTMRALKYFLMRLEKEQFSDDISESTQRSLSIDWKKQEKRKIYLNVFIVQWIRK